MLNHLDEGILCGDPVRRWARTPCPKLLRTSKKDFHVEWFLSFEHEIDSPAEFMGKDGKCLWLAVFADQAVVEELSLFISP